MGLSSIKDLWLYLALAALAFVIYANALANGFVSDDTPQLLNNPVITNPQGISGSVLGILGHDVWRNAHPEQASNYYRPLQFLVYLALYTVAGPSAFAFHLLLVLIHVANTLFVYRVSRRFTQLVRWPALVAAALFAVHPIHEEAVVWIAVLPDLLLTFFALYLFDLWIRRQASPRGLQIVPYATLFFAALLTKEPAVMLLPLLALYEWIYLGRTINDLWKNRALYATLTGVFCVYLAMRVHALGGLAPGQDNRFHLNAYELSLNVIALLGQYLFKLIAPISLRYHYEFTPLHGVSLSVIVALIAIVAVLAAAWTLRRKQPLMAFALLWIILPLLPALNITGVGETVFADRYLYLPSVGFVWIAALAWSALARKQQQLAWILAAIVIATASYAVVARNPEWRDELQLFTVAVQENPQSAAMIDALAGVHQEMGQLDTAVAEYRQASQLRPGDASILANLSGVLVVQGRHEEAIAEARKAIAANPNYAGSYVNLGVALDATGHPNEAVAALEKALQLRPEYPEALNGLALIKRRVKDYAAAIPLLERAVAAKPSYTEALFNLGVTYSDTGDYKGAATAFRGALAVARQNSSLYLIHYGLGVCYVHLNAPQAAAVEFATTLQLRPDYARARDSLQAVQRMLQQK